MRRSIQVPPMSSRGETIKPGCLGCGSTDIEWILIEDGAIGKWRSCDMELRLKRRTEEQGIRSLLKRLFGKTKE